MRSCPRTSWSTSGEAGPRGRPGVRARNTQGDVPQDRGEGGGEQSPSRDAEATGREVPGCGSAARDGASAYVVGGPVCLRGLQVQGEVGVVIPVVAWLLTESRRDVGQHRYEIRLRCVI